MLRTPLLKKHEHKYVLYLHKLYLNLINKPRLFRLPVFSIYHKCFWTFSLGAAELLLNCSHVRFLALKGCPGVMLGFSPPLGKTLISLFGAFWLPGEEWCSVWHRIKFLSVQTDKRKHFDLQTQSEVSCSLFLLLLLILCRPIWQFRFAHLVITSWTWYLNLEIIRQIWHF